MTHILTQLLVVGVRNYKEKREEYLECSSANKLQKNFENEGVLQKCEVSVIKNIIMSKIQQTSAKSFI